MEIWLQILITAGATVIASSGFWAWVQKRNEGKDSKTQLLVGLAHDRILQSGMFYINRGYITRDEYENLHDYLYAPYRKLGGNGSAKHIMELVDKLEVRENPIRNSGRS